MAGATSPDNIHVVQVGDDLTPLETQFALVADSVQDAFDNRFRGVAGPVYSIPVADAADRAVKFPTPVQGNSVFRIDKGWTERYYGTYDATTNPGGALAGAGWYPVEGILPFYTSYQSGTDAIANATWEASDLGGTVTNRGGFSQATGILTVPVPGFYTVSVNVKFAPNTVGSARGIRFKIDGSVTVNNEWNNRYPNGFVLADLPVGAMWQGYVASTISPEYYQNSGGNLNLHARYITARYMGAG